MDRIFEEWKKEMEDKLKRFIEKKELEKPIQKQKCPKCMKTTLEFDEERGCFKCSNCGFEYCVKKVK